jgi:putative protease
LATVQQAEADGVIVSDPGVLTLCRNQFPELPIHLSTQANTTNWAAVEFWRSQGVSRINLAREMSLDEIKEIRRKNSQVELEVFVHGAMCMSYSGRCLLSNYFTGRDANRGDCAQSCRWKYALVEEKRPDLYLPIEEDNLGTYILSAGDLCLLESIPKLMAVGINSLKIEGRMKSIYYVAGVVKSYREAIDICQSLASDQWNPQPIMEELSKISHRDFTTGFLYGQPQSITQSNEDKLYQREYSFIGLVLDYNPETGMALVEQRNHFAKGDRIEIMNPIGSSFSFTLAEMYDQAGNSLQTAPHPQQLINIPIDHPVVSYSMLRKQK